ncbi:MAG TPA: molybdopterin-dependent oxidoreductase [Kofleriaceae bacterium]|nr:molybdopterin-dependent oxidoreductase [Kofleriaceae bacterium]
MTRTVYRSCHLCEATCGVAITVEGDRVTGVRGDPDDPFSRGYVCPKATALADLHHDPDRLQRPIARDGRGWRELGWDEAFDLVAERLRGVRRAHGRDAIAVYQGNPSVHSLGLMTYGRLLTQAIGTRNQYSATSLDQLPHMLAAHLMFGDQLLLPTPDIDRCDLFICLGGNPLASNGSLMTAPDVRGRLKAIRARGGQVIVIDPRRTETAARADRHLFIRPGSDAVLLLAMASVLFDEDLVVKNGRVPLAGVADLRRFVAAWSPERAAPITGIAADDIRALTRAFAAAPRAVLYGRIGVCTQEFGGVAAWLCYALNALTGHLDAPGGLMFTTPAVDPLQLAPLLGVKSGFARWRSRVGDHPEFGGELPMTALAEELETPGDGQIRALVTIAGNPVLSAPGGPRLEQAFGQLDFMVAIDPYLNETTRLAHVILPPASPLERTHYDLALNLLAVRNVAKFSPPVFARPEHARHDWEICIALWRRLGRLGGGLFGGVTERALGAVGPEKLVDLALRLGPHRLSLRQLEAAPHGVDLGPLEPRLPRRLATADRKVHVAPRDYLADLARLEQRYRAPDAGAGLILIGRRDLRSNNSWLHNSARLTKGPARCTLLIHPDDAAPRGLTDGATAKVSTARGAIELPVEISDAMMPGVVSVPHGWGHRRAGTQLRVASATPGESVNDIIDPAVIDQLSGTSALTGQRVEVSAI